MAHGNSTTVHVHDITPELADRLLARQVPCEIVPGYSSTLDGNDLRGESLIQLDELDVLHLHSRELQHLVRGIERADAHARGVEARESNGLDITERFVSQLSGLVCTHDQGSSGSVRNWRRVPRRDRSVFYVEVGFQLPERLHGLIFPRPNVFFQGLELWRHIEGNHLIFELSGLERARPAPMAFEGKFVLFSARDTEITNKHLCSEPHNKARDGVGEPFDETDDRDEVTRPEREDGFDFCAEGLCALDC